MDNFFKGEVEDLKNELNATMGDKHINVCCVVFVHLLAVAIAYKAKRLEQSIVSKIEEELEEVMDRWTEGRSG
jgi:hypothetical protein